MLCMTNQFICSCYTQGMEQVVRKLVTHVEYEPNWETGFLMQLWMMPVIEAMIAWSTSDVSSWLYVSI